MHAGCVIASRLSKALPHLSFLVIEAGPAQDARVLPGLGYIPGLPHSGDTTRIEWDTASTPQARLGGTSFDLPSGKILGGSSAINFANWCRGPSVD